MANSELQKSPQGLLGAFDLQTQGQNPSAFGDTVLPTVDVLPFYVARQMVVADEVGLLQVNGGVLTRDVSAATGAYLLWAATCDIGLLAGDTMPDGLGASLIVTPNTHVAPGCVVLTGERWPPRAGGLAANATYTAARSWERPLLLLPGTRIQFRLEATLPIAARSCRMLLMVSPYRV